MPLAQNGRRDTLNDVGSGWPPACCELAGERQGEALGAASGATILVTRPRLAASTTERSARCL